MGVEELLQNLMAVGANLMEVGTLAYLSRHTYEERKLRNKIKGGGGLTEEELLKNIIHLQSGNLIYTDIPSNLSGLQKKVAQTSRFAKKAYGWSKYFFAGMPESIRLRLLQENGKRQYSMELVHGGNVKYSGIFDLGRETRESLSKAAFNLKTMHGYPFEFNG